MSKIATDTAHSQPNRKPRSRFSTILNNAIIDGLTVLPGLLGEKHPCVNWTEFQDTPPTDEHYEKWLRQFAKGNGFYLLGATYGRFVVDADTFEANEELAKRVEVETQTLRSARGPHYHFQWPGFHVFNSTSELGKGLDVRGQGGVAAAAGSLHVNGKHSYHWVPGHSPDDVELAPRRHGYSISYANNPSASNVRRARQPSRLALSRAASTNGREPLSMAN
jgi:hypothetical protein